MLKVGLAGCGYWGKRWMSELEYLHTEGTLQFYGVCDSDASALLRLGDVPYAKMPNLEALAEKCGAVILATPNETHYPLAESLLSMGQAVLIEKPIAVNRKEADMLLKMQEAGGIILPGHVYRFSDLLRELKKRVSPMQVPSAVLIRWTDFVPLKLGDASVIEDLMPHVIDILQMIFEKFPTFSSCRVGRWRGKGAYHKVIEHAIIEGNIGSADLLVELGWDRPIKHRSIEIVMGTTAVSCDVVMRPDFIVSQSVFPSSSIRDEIWVPPNNLLRDELRFFVRMVEQEKKHPLMLQDAVYGIGLIEQLKEMSVHG